MIEYVLSWIEQSGIKGERPLCHSSRMHAHPCEDVLLICPTGHRPAIYHHIHSDVSSSNLNIDLQTYDETIDSSVGTCTLLRHFASRIREDFVLLPCDFIAPPSLPLTTLLNRFRADSGSDGSIATACWYAAPKPEKTTSPEEWGLVTPPTPIVWDDNSGTLLHVDTADDLDKNSEELKLRMSLLSMYASPFLSSPTLQLHFKISSSSPFVEFPRFPCLCLQTVSARRPARETALRLFPRRISSVAVQGPVPETEEEKIRTRFGYSLSLRPQLMLVLFSSIPGGRHAIFPVDCFTTFHPSHI